MPAAGYFYCPKYGRHFGDKRVTERFKQSPEIICIPGMATEDKTSQLTPPNSTSSNTMTDENNLNRRDHDNFDDRVPLQREMKRSKSMSCLPSNVLLFPDSFLSNTLSTFRNSPPVTKSTLRTSGPFKRPLPPRRRVSFLIPSEGDSEQSDNSAAFEFTQPRNTLQGDDFCFNSNFPFKGVESMFLQRSQSFCDPRSRDGHAESWRDLL